MADESLCAKIAIFDLDGCVFDDRKRRHLLPTKGTKNQSEFKLYHDMLFDDLPFSESLGLIFKHHDAGDNIVFNTSRPVSYMAESITALQRVLFRKSKDKIPFTIHMRPTGSDKETVSLKRSVAVKLMAPWVKVVAAYDDRQDIVDMYRELGIAAQVLDERGLIPPPAPMSHVEFAEDGPTQKSTFETPPNRERDAGDILLDMGRTFKERNALYKDNAVLVGALMAVMFPNGVTLKTPEDFHMWHLFELKIVKLTRFIKSGLKHEDSIHDDAIYSAMCERLVNTHNIQVN